MLLLNSLLLLPLACGTTPDKEEKWMASGDMKLAFAKPSDGLPGITADQLLSDLS